MLDERLERVERLERLAPPNIFAAQGHSPPDCLFLRVDLFFIYISTIA